MGEGSYMWVGLDGVTRSGDHWDDLPERMDRIIVFSPDYPEAPHTQEQHDEMERFSERLREAMRRCLR